MEAVFEAPQIGRKYIVESILYSVLGALIVFLGVFIWMLSREAIGQGTMLFPNDPGFDYLLLALIFGPFAIGPLVALIHLRNTAREKYLYTLTNGRELVVTPESLRVSIGLIEGPLRAKLRTAGQAYLVVKWSEISEVKMTKRHFEIACYRAEAVRVTRKSFQEKPEPKEEALLATLTTYLPRPIVRS